MHQSNIITGIHCMFLLKRNEKKNAFLIKIVVKKRTETIEERLKTELHKILYAQTVMKKRTKAHSR